VFCPAASFSGAAGQLAALAGAAAKELSGGLPSLFVLHVDSVSGALALRETPTSGSGGSLRPCEVKVAAGVVEQMVQLQSRWVWVRRVKLGAVGDSKP